MREDLLFFDTALLAKEKGFDTYSEDYYDTGHPTLDYTLETSLYSVTNTLYHTKTYPREFIRKWLNEKGIFVEVSVWPDAFEVTANGKPKLKYTYKVFKFELDETEVWRPVAIREGDKDVEEAAWNEGLNEGLNEL